MHVVSAEDVEADGLQLIAVEEEIDRSAERNSVQTHGQGKQLVGAMSLHEDIVPRSGTD
jgi:hypothetical protein